MAEIKLKDNYLSLIKDGITSESFTGLKQGILDSIKSYNKAVFVTTFQNLITQLAMIVSNALITPVLESGSYYNACATYLTKEVISDESLYSYLLASKINENGNIVKHSIDDIRGVDMETIIYIYNKLVSFLVLKLEADDLASIKIDFNEKKPELKPSGVKSLWTGNEDVKYLLLGDNKLKVSLDKYCSIDLYKKTILANLIIDIEEGNPNDSISLDIQSKNNESLRKISIKAEKYPFNLTEAFTVNDKDMDDDTLNVNLVFSIVTIVKEKKEEAVKIPYQTGSRFNQTTSYRTTYKMVTKDVEKALASETINLSQGLNVRK